MTGAVVTGAVVTGAVVTGAVVAGAAQSPTVRTPFPTLAFTVLASLSLSSAARPTSNRFGDFAFAAMVNGTVRRVPPFLLFFVETNPMINVPGVLAFTATWGPAITSPVPMESSGAVASAGTKLSEAAS